MTTPKPWILLCLCVPLGFWSCGDGEDAPRDGSSAEAGAGEGPDGGTGVPHPELDPGPPPGRGDRAAANPLAAEGAAAIAAGRLSQGADLLGQALEKDPAHAPALFVLGQVTLQRGATRSPAKALRCFRSLRALHQQAPERLRAELPRPQLAFELELGEARARALLRETETALRMFRSLRDQMRATPRPPDLQAEVLRGLGTTLYEAEHWNEAIEVLDQSLALQGRNWEARMARAQCLERRGDLAEAEAELLRAIALAPGKGRLHYLRSRLMTRLERPAEAERERRIYEILNRFEDDVSKRFAEDYEQRITLWRELIELYPDYEQAPAQLVRVLIEAQRPEDALSELDAMLERDPGDGEALFLQAKARHAAGDAEGARRSADAMRALGEAPEAVYLDLLKQIDQEPAPAGTQGDERD